LSVKSYFDEEAPLCNVESYIYRREDIITLKPGRENAWLDAFVEGTLQKFSCIGLRVSAASNAKVALDSNSTDSTDILLLVYVLYFG
jgi:hypothetical protein